LDSLTVKIRGWMLMCDGSMLLNHARLCFVQ